MPYMPLRQAAKPSYRAKSMDPPAGRGCWAGGALRFHQRVYDAASIALALHGEGENRARAGKIPAG